MAKISTQAVIDAITLALRAAYPQSQIEDDDVAQGITPGAFIVTTVSAEQQRLTGQRYHRAPLFNVLYFSDNSSPECVDVADSLFMVLNTVTTPGGDLLHGSGMTWRIEDDVLHFMVGYDYNIRLERELDRMETLNVQEGILYG